MCVLAGPYVKLTLLGQAPAGGAPLSVTPRLATVSSTPASAQPLLTGNPVLDREQISAPQAADVRIPLRCF